MLPTLGSSVPVASGRCSPVASELRRWVPRAPESLPGARVTTARSFDFVQGFVCLFSKRLELLLAGEQRRMGEEHA